MKNFDSFYTELISNYVWFQPASMHHEPKTFEDTARKVYMQYVASEHFPPIQEARRHVYNKLVLVPGDRKKVDWVKIAKKELDEKEAAKKPVEPPLTGEARAQRLKEWEAIVKGSTMLNSMPKPSYKELAEEGGVLPPKPAPYPCTSKEEVYIRERRFEYIKNNYEPRTGQPLPNWIDEREWNLLYDHKMIL